MPASLARVALRPVVWGTRSVDRTKYQIQIPLPPKIDPSVTMMTVEEKPDVTYSDIGGCKEQVPSPPTPNPPPPPRPHTPLRGKGFSAPTLRLS